MGKEWTRRMKKLKLICESSIICLSVFFIALGLDKMILAVLSIFVAPLIIIWINNKFKINLVRYYGALSIIFIVSFITSGIMIQGKVEGYKGEMDINNEETGKEYEEETTSSNGADDSEELDSNEATNAVIHFINTGNSDSILIVQGDKSVLIDSGGNNDKEIVYNYLKDQDIEELTYMILACPHEENIDGLYSILNNIKVENLFISNTYNNEKACKDFVNLAVDKGVEYSIPLQGAEYELSESSYIKIFDTNVRHGTKEQSFVILFVNGDDKALFTGDVEIDNEVEILDKISQVDLLKIMQHDSKTITSDIFLNNSTAKCITTNEDSIIVSKLKNAGVEAHRTDKYGTKVFYSSGFGILTD